MLASDAYDQRFAARLQEFWAWSTPWHRRLWNVGSTAAIRELLEASDSLPPPAIKAMQAEVDRLVGPDIAIGPAPVRGTLHALLTDTLTFQGANWHQLSELMFVIDADYLKRWEELLGQTIQQGKPGYERAARSVATHLLQSGFSPTYLHRWLNYQVRGRPDALTSADLVHEAEVALVHKPSTAFRVVLPVLSAPKVAGAPPKEWFQADEIARLISAIQGAKSSVRQNGGFVLTIEARDQYAAVDQARELIDRWDARAELSVRERIVRTDKAWVEGVTDPILCSPTRRRVGITALRTQNQIYSPLDPNEPSIRIDDAFQLVQPMQAGPRSAAISGGWAAIESLLTVRGEAEHVAAQRLASIIACSYPRAELTNLSYVHAANNTDAVAVALQLEQENLKRARITANALSSGHAIQGTGDGDDAACDRMRELLAHPRETLRKVTDYVSISLHRLYRQRNLTLHGGRVGGDGRSEALATAPPLIGAGLDRIANAWFVERTAPMELAARAQISLELVGSVAGRHITELLEPRA